MSDPANAVGAPASGAPRDEAPRQAPVRIAIVEDDADLRERFARVIRDQADFELSGVAASLAEARARIVARAPDVTLVDLGLPDGSGIELIRELAPRGVACMVISVFGDERHVVHALEAGALGYLLKDEARERIPLALRELLAGGSPISSAIARHLLRRMRCGDAVAQVLSGSDAVAERPHLSPRESEVLQLMVKGFTYAEAAGLLGVSSHTVATYVRNVYKKLAVHSRGEAVYEALQLGLVRAYD